MTELIPPDYNIFVSEPVVNGGTMQATIKKVGKKIDYLSEGQEVIFHKGKFGRVIINGEEYFSVTESYILGVL